MKKILFILGALSLQIAQCVDIIITNATGILNSELQASVMSSLDSQRNFANFDNDGKALLQSSIPYNLRITKLPTYPAPDAQGRTIAMARIPTLIGLYSSNTSTMRNLRMTDTDQFELISAEPIIFNKGPQAPRPVAIVSPKIDM